LRRLTVVTTVGPVLATGCAADRPDTHKPKATDPGPAATPASFPELTATSEDIVVPVIGAAAIHQPRAALADHVSGRVPIAPAAGGGMQVVQP